MARTTSFGYTNTTDSTKSLTLKKLGLVTNYVEVDSQGDDYVLDNITAPSDQTERIRINSYSTKNVKLNSGVTNEHPDDTSGMTLVIGLDSLLSTTDSAVPEYRVDDGLSLTLTARYGKTSRVTAAHEEEALIRLMSICFDDAGNSRLATLMRGSKRINAD